MRKIFLFGLVAFAVIVGAGGSILWFIQAADIKKGVEQAIAAINEKQPYVTYEAITTSGFPTQVIVTIVKPRFTGRIDTLLANSHAVQPGATLPEWTEDVTLDGAIILSVNALSDRYTLKITGDWRTQGKIGDQAIAISSQSSGDLVCGLSMKRSFLFNNLWNWHTLAQKDFIRDFRELDCLFPPYTAVNAATQTPITRSGGGRLYVSSEPKGWQQQLRFFFKSTDMEILPEGEKTVQAYASALAPGEPFAASLTVYGKQNIDVDFSYNGPMDWRATPDVPIDITLSKFDISNQAYTVHATLRAATSLTGGMRSATIAFRAESTFTELYDAMMHDMARAFIRDLYAQKETIHPPVRQYMETHTPDQFYQTVAPAIPNFFSLGKTVEALDLSYQGADDFSSGDATLTTLELSASPYGITGKGTVKRSQGQLFPAANITLVCSNCLSLIDDIAGYAMRVEKAMTEIDPAQVIVHIDPAAVEGAKRFLTALAEVDNANFTYAILSDGSGNINISGKSMDQVMALYEQHMAAALQQPAPPSQ